MTEFIQFVTEHGPEIITALLGTKVLANLIVNFTETPADDKIVGKVYKFIEWLGGIWTDAAKQHPPGKE